MIELIEVIDPQVLKMTIALKQVIADHQQGMANSHDRSLAAPMGGDALEEGSEVAVFAPGCAPSALTELLSQPAASLASLSAETLTSAFIVSGADPRPGGQIVRRGETGSCRCRFRQ